MNKVKIITDSTADLTQELYEKLDITVLPLYVTIGEKTYKDGIEITAKELYKKVNEHNQLPKTSAVSPIVFEEEFKKYIDLGYDVLYLGIGSEFSGTFNNARIAASNFPKDRIRLVDSANLSSGIGLLLLKANQFKEKV